MEGNVDYSVKLKTDLSKALKAIDSAGRFAASGSLSTNPPAWLHVEGVGDIDLPLSEEQARQIIATSYRIPSGLGKETPVDQQQHRGGISEISPDRLEFFDPNWPGFLIKLGQVVGKKLGVDVPIRMKLDKMVIYEKGAVPKPHTETTEKTRGMFGTLMICLPSAHTGGQVLVKYDGESMLLGETDSSLSFACWYSDVTHQVLPVQSGYRCVLLYNLATRPDRTRPTARALYLKGGPLRDTLKYWHRDLTNKNISNVPTHLYHAIGTKSAEVQTTGANNKSNLISGLPHPKIPTAKSMAWSRALRGLVRGLPFEVFLAFLEKAVTGPVWLPSEDEDDDDSYGESNVSFHEIYDVEQTEYTVRSLDTLDGTAIGRDYEFDLKFCLEAEPFLNVIPVEDYYGDSATHQYQRWAIVIVPHEAIVEYVTRAAFDLTYVGTWTTPYIQSRTFISSENLSRTSGGGSTAYESALSYVGNIRSLPSAQTTMLDKTCILYVSHENRGYQMATLLRTALEHSHYTLFQTVGVRHNGLLPRVFFNWAKEWLSKLPDEDRTEKYRTWIPLLIQNYTSMSNILRITEMMSSPKSDAGVLDTAPPYCKTWAQDVIYPCIVNFPHRTQEPAASDGKAIVKAIFDLEKESTEKFALLTSIVDSFPQPDAMAFLIALLHSLKTQAAAEDLATSATAELYRNICLRVFNHKRKLCDIPTKAEVKYVESGSYPEEPEDDPFAPEFKLIVTPDVLVELVCDLSEMSTDEANVLDPVVDELRVQCATFSAGAMQHLWMPFLCQLISALASRSISFETPIYQQLARGFMAQFDEQVIGAAPQAPPAVLSGCECENCVDLNKFLKDEKVQVQHFVLAKAKRQHLERKIRFHRIPCTHRTIDTAPPSSSSRPPRHGPPRTLVVTKEDTTAKWEERKRRLYAVLAQKIQLEHLQCLLGPTEAERIQSVAKLAPPLTVPSSPNQYYYSYPPRCGFEEPDSSW